MHNCDSMIMNIFMNIILLMCVLAFVWYSNHNWIHGLIQSNGFALKSHVVHILTTCGSHVNHMLFTCYPHVAEPHVVHMLTICGSHINHMWFTW